MSELRKVGEIEIAQDLPFQRREWKIQRIGWMIMLLITVAALAGAFGDGALARAQQRTAGGELVVRYDRIARHLGQTRLEIWSATTASADLAIWLSTEYLDGVRLLNITPEPEQVVTGDGRITYRFKTSANPKITFLLDPEKSWRRKVALGLEGGPALRFTQLVLP